MERQNPARKEGRRINRDYRRLCHLDGKTMSALTAFGMGLISRAMSGFFVTNATRRRRRTCETARARARA
jgi:hypothetical protein